MLEYWLNLGSVLLECRCAPRYFDLILEQLFSGFIFANLAIRIAFKLYLKVSLVAGLRKRGVDRADLESWNFNIALTCALRYHFLLLLLVVRKVGFRLRLGCRFLSVNLGPQPITVSVHLVARPDATPAWHRESRLATFITLFGLIRSELSLVLRSYWLDCFTQAEAQDSSTHVHRPHACPFLCGGGHNLYRLC